MSSRAFIALIAVSAFAAALSEDASGQCDPITTELVADGFAVPVYVTAPPGDTSRLFVVERGGDVAVINLNNGSVNSTPFISVGDLITADDSEQGLLGMAFDPDYATNGYFYLNYTNTEWDTVIARYRVLGNPATSSVADPDSAVILKTIGQPFSNHNGGCLQFGPDGMLYCGMGDGGSHGDPGGRAQNPGSLLGKMLRLDVDRAPDYIPLDNPYVGQGNPRDEIYQMGLRNPWRYSFDRLTGDLFIADVGEGDREEVNYIPAGQAAGLNFGWNCYEGTQEYAGCGDPGDFHQPIHDYSHSQGAAVTGGYVYRGDALPSWRGTYFFADFGSSQIWTFRVAGGNVTGFANRTATLNPDGPLNVNFISSFGEGPDGELYIVDYVDAEVFRIVPRAPQTDCNENGLEDSCDIADNRSDDANDNGVPDECEGGTCDADFAGPSGGGPDGTVNVFDLFILLGNWNSAGPGASLAAPNNVVNVFDMFVLLQAFGDC